MVASTNGVTCPRPVACFFVADPLDDALGVLERRAAEFERIGVHLLAVLAAGPDGGPGAPTRRAASNGAGRLDRIVDADGRIAASLGAQPPQDAEPGDTTVRTVVVIDRSGRRTPLVGGHDDGDAWVSWTLAMLGQLGLGGQASATSTNRAV